MDKQTLPNLANDKRKFSYRSLLFGRNLNGEPTGGMYLQRFDCIVGKKVAFKNTEIVPVIHLTLPNADGEQFPTIDENGAVKTSVRDVDWHDRVTKSQVELDAILNSFAESVATEV